MFICAIADALLLIAAAMPRYMLFTLYAIYVRHAAMPLPLPLMLLFLPRRYIVAATFATLMFSSLFRQSYTIHMLMRFSLLLSRRYAAIVAYTLFIIDTLDADAATPCCHRHAAMFSVAAATCCRCH